MIQNIAVIFGGRSCEHEISILSALQVMEALQEAYHVIPIYISKQDELYSGKKFKELTSFQDMQSLLKKNNRICLKRKGKEVYLMKRWHAAIRIDFVFPIMHGTSGEDGTIQGYLELLHIPYAGSTLLGSAMAQSKVISKQWLQAHQIPTLDFDIINRQQKETRFSPCIIKPSNLGSSIGIQIAHTKQAYTQLVEEALRYDDECIVEPYISEFREINCSVKQTKNGIFVSELEEVMKQEDILSFVDKYERQQKQKGMSNRKVKPQLDNNIEQQIKDISYKVFNLFHLRGVIRIDFMLIEGTVYVNELNTIPGSYAYYLWPQQTMLNLLEDVMEDALREYVRKECMITSFDSKVLFLFAGNKMKG